MALVRIYQKPAGTPANSSVFAVEIQQNNIWYTKKVSWEDLKGLIAGATSLVFQNGTVTFTTPDGVAHEVLSVDDEVLAASGNPVTGGAVSTALAGKQDTLTFDQVPTDGSTNPVESNGIYDALALKQDTLTFDSTPTDGSTNPVTSQGIYAAISAVTSGIDWKEAVATYADIATTYPNPEDGWTVTTLDDDHTYRYTGTEWVDMFSLITLATSTKDGLMSSADFTKLSGIEAGATRTIVDDALSTSSTNPVQNKVITGKLNTFLDVNETITTNPYTKRFVPSGKYTEKLRKIVGATVNWNQLRKDELTSGSNNQVTFTVDNTNHTITVNGTASGGRATFDYALTQFYSGLKGHKFLFMGGANGNCEVGYYGGNNGKGGGTTSSTILSINETYGLHRLYLMVDNGKTCNNEIVKPMATDLTAMFGTAIADRAYTMEQAEAGSGIAWLQSYGFFNEDYYAYSANTLQSVSLAAKVNIGKNLFGGLLFAQGISNAGYNVTIDTTAKTVKFTHEKNNTDNIVLSGFPLIENTRYTFIMSYKNAGNNYSLRVRYTDNTVDYIPLANSSSEKETVVLTTAQNKSVKDVFLSYYADAETTLYYEECGMFKGVLTADDFEPYEEITTELDSTPLRGLFGLDANNNIVANGDEYTPDGSDEVKWGEMNLGELNYTYNSTNDYFYTSMPSDSAANITGGNAGICEKYLLFNGGVNDFKATNNTFTFNNSSFGGAKTLFIRDTSTTDPAVLKTALSGVKLVYPLATPTTATLTPYEKLQPIEQGGTEEFIDYGVQSGTRDVAIPAGNETAYGDNENMGKIINYMTT